MHPKIYVVNLARSLHRRARMEQQLAELGLDGTFVAATDGHCLSPADLSVVDVNARVAMGYIPLTPGEIGCYLSHLRLWRQIASGDEDWAVILEDDILLDGDIPAILSQLEDIPRPWDIIRLAGLFQAPSVTIRNLGRTYSLDLLLNTACGLQAYCLSKRGAEKLLARATPIIRPVDNQVDRYWENGLMVFAIQPYPARQDESMRSDIGSARRDQAHGDKKPWRRKLGKWRDSITKRWCNLVLLVRARRFSA